MKFIFIDETANPRVNKDFYGVCAVAVDATKYSGLTNDFYKCMKKYGWSDEEEFKGRFLFSSTKGDKSVAIEDRIKLARELISLNVSTQNARLTPVFSCNSKGDKRQNHLNLVSDAVVALLPKNEVDPITGTTCLLN